MSAHTSFRFKAPSETIVETAVRMVMSGIDDTNPDDGSQGITANEGDASESNFRNRRVQKITFAKELINKAIAMELRTMNVSLLFYRLPAEISVIIFGMVINDSPLQKSPLKLAQTLSTVSTRWRTLIHSTPSFWTSINANDPTPLITKALEVSSSTFIQLTTAAPRPELSPYAFMHPADADVVKLLNATSTQINRWSSAALLFKDDGAAIPWHRMQVPASNIRRLVLEWRRTAFDASQSVNRLDPNLEIFTGHAPLLEDLTLDRFLLRPDSGLFTTLKNLTIRMPGDYNLSHLWVALLSAKEHLSKLDVQIESPRNLTDPLPALRTLKFPQLVHLRLNVLPAYFSHLLPLIEAPACLNLTFRYHGSMVEGLEVVERYPASALREAPRITLHVETTGLSFSPFRFALSLSSSGAGVRLEGIFSAAEIGLAYGWMLGHLGRLGAEDPSIHCEVRGNAEPINTAPVDAFVAVIHLLPHFTDLTLIDVDNADSWLLRYLANRIPLHENGQTNWLFPLMTRIGLCGCKVDPASILKMLKSRYGVGTNATPEQNSGCPVPLKTLDVGMCDRVESGIWSEVEAIVGEGVLV